MVSDYRLSQRIGARLMGFALAGLGLVVFIATLAVALLGLPATALTVTLVGVVVVLLAVGFLLTRKPWIVRLDQQGYQVRFVRGAGVQQARWKDVEDAVATTVAGERCVVLRLRDGRTTTVPVRLLATDPDQFVTDLQTHLNRGHGYRRLR